jgi:hypothetical protein
MFTSISVATDPAPVIEWLLKKGEVMGCDRVTPGMLSISVPVFVNSGIIGYTLRPIALRDTLKVLQDAVLKKQLQDQGIYLLPSTPEQFKVFLTNERKKWGELLKRLNIRAS